MDYPLCFGSKTNFEAWVAKSESDGLIDPRLSFCHYCTPAFQKLMTVQQKCEYPELDIEALQIEDEYQMELF
jgi:hypothetical protein